MSATSLWRSRVDGGFLVAVGGFTIAAAALKGHQIAYHGMPSGNLFKSIPLYLLLIVAEFFLGVWLISGLYRRAARLVAALCFFGFMDVALWLAINGQKSCGCLGQVAMSPWIAVALDFGICVGLVSLRLDGPERTLHAHRLRFAGFLLVALAVGIPGYMTMAVYRREATNTLELRHDRLLHDTKVAVELEQPTANALVTLLAEKSATSVSIDDAVREQFEACQPNWKLINHRTLRGWAVLEAIPKCMPVQSRWIRTTDGYVLIGDDPLQRAKAYWMACLTIGMLGFCCLAWNARREIPTPG